MTLNVDILFYEVCRTQLIIMIPISSPTRGGKKL